MSELRGRILWLGSAPTPAKIREAWRGDLTSKKGVQTHAPGDVHGQWRVLYVVQIGCYFPESIK